jgi:hypothetical protein
MLTPIRWPAAVELTGMDFRIADTFTDSLTKLEADEQKAVKTTAFDLQMNPASPGKQFHRVKNTRLTPMLPR